MRLCYISAFIAALMLCNGMAFKTGEAKLRLLQSLNVDDLSSRLAHTVCKPKDIYCAKRMEEYARRSIKALTLKLKYIPLKNSDSDCQQCKQMDEMVEKMFTRQFLNDELSKFCHRLPVFMRKCMKELNIHSEKIHKLVLSGVHAKDHCTGFCLLEKVKSVSSMPSVVSPVDNAFQPKPLAEKLISKYCQSSRDVHCQQRIFIYMRQVMTLAYQQFQSVVRTHQQANDVVCDECKTLAQSYLDSLYTAEMQQKIMTTVQGLCQKLSFLKAECQTEVPKLLPQILDLLREHLHSADLCHMIGACNEMVTLKQNGLTTCSLCQSIASVVKLLLDQKQTQEKIDETLDKLCNDLPVFKATCINTVNKVVALIDEEFDPNNVCKELKMCPKVAIRTKNVPKSNGKIDCLSCKTVVSTMKIMFESKATQEAIFHEAEQVCSILPSLKSACMTLARKAYDYLDDDLEPKQICQSLNICEAKIRTPKKVKGPADCSICLLLAGQVKSLISEGQKWEEIKPVLVGICKKVPVFQARCMSFINKVEQLTNPDEDLHVFCQNISACPGAVVNKFPVDFECKFCKVLGEKAEELFESATVEHVLKIELDALCAKMGKVASICDSLVDAFVSYMSSGFDYETVCQVTGFCQTPLSAYHGIH